MRLPFTTTITITADIALQHGLVAPGGSTAGHGQASQAQQTAPVRRKPTPPPYAPTRGALAHPKGSPPPAHPSGLPPIIFGKKPNVPPPSAPSGKPPPIATVGAPPGGTASPDAPTGTAAGKGSGTGSFLATAASASGRFAVAAATGAATSLKNTAVGTWTLADKGDTYLDHALLNGPSDPVVAQGNATIVHAVQHVATAVAAVKDPAGAARTLWSTASGEAERLYAGAQAADAAGTLPEYLGGLAGEGAAQIAALPMEEVKGAALLGGLAHEGEALGAAGEVAFEVTKPVVVTGKGAIELGRSYERAVSRLYNNAPFPKREYETIVNGKRVFGVADDITTVNGLDTAVEAKFSDGWEISIRNPAYAGEGKPWAGDAQREMVDQAAKYAEAFSGGVIYHTNSVELANHYSQVFRDAGITKFHFVITPTTKP